MTEASELSQGHEPPALVVLPTEIDLASAPAVTETLNRAARAGPAVLVADLTGTTFCDCAAARALRLATQYAAAHGADLRLVVPAGPVHRILRLTGLDRELHLYPDIPGALTTPRPPADPLPS